MIFFSHTKAPGSFFLQKSGLSRSWRPLPETCGFSLTEVVIAMGVATVAFTSIIALFPLGLNMSKESYESVQAALLAQTIMADMRDQGTGSKNLRVNPTYKYKLIQVGPNSDPIGDANTNYKAIYIDLTSSQTNYVAYNLLARTNSDTDPTKAAELLRPCAYSSNSVPAWYTGGSNGLFALAKITISPTCRFNGSASSQPSRVDISIETPGSAKASNRTQYLFTGVVRP
ncbi:hypothetical protein EBX31_10395 [bacterium]|nr:hypothetical protein [bacterium]